MPYADKETRKEKQKAYRLRQRQNKPEQVLLHSAKMRAKKRSLEFNLDIEDIVIPTVCPYLGIPITPGGGSGRQPGSPSIDRIDNELGYIKGNIVICSWRANELKKDAGYQELQLLVNSWGSILRDR